MSDDFVKENFSRSIDTLKGRWFPLTALTLAVLVFTTTIGFASSQHEAKRMTILLSLSIVQLTLAGPAYLWLRKTFQSSAPRPFDRPFALSWAESCIGLFALVVVLLLISYLTFPADRPSQTLMAIAWLVPYQILLIGLAEELIFRGVPFAVLPRQSWAAPMVSSLLFALYHWNTSLLLLPYFFALGLLFAIPRHFGFPLSVLALGHGLFNIILETIWPIGGYRFGPVAFSVVMPLALICLGMFVGWMLSALEKNARREMRL